MPDVIDTPDFVIALDEIDMQPDGAWELTLTFNDGEHAPMIGRGQFRLMRFQDAITSRSDFVWQRGSKASNCIEAELDGSIDDSTLYLQIYLLEPGFKRAPFICKGSAVIQNLYQGRWQIQCIQPDVCNEDCSGVDGNFTFAKLS